MWIKMIILSFVFLFSGCATLNPPKASSLNPDDIVQWSETRKLSWEDFKGEPIINESLGSEIYIQMPGEFQKSNLFLPSSTKVYCFMIKKSSWVNKSKVNEQQLLYNQTLFDIYELYTRRIRKKFAETNFGIVDPNGVFNSIYNANVAELGNAVTQYRSETKMGLNNDKVKEWSGKILEEINGLHDYKDE